MIMRIKVGIVGSRSYTDKKKIKDLLFEMKEKYGDEVEIVSGGQKDGADGFAKKYALAMYKVTAAELLHVGPVFNEEL